MKAFYLLLLFSCLANAEQQPISDKRDILKKVYGECRIKSDIMTCVDKLTKFGKQIGYDQYTDGSPKLEMSLFFLVQDDLSSADKRRLDEIERLEKTQKKAWAQNIHGKK